MYSHIKKWVSEHQQTIVLFILLFLISSISFGIGYVMGGDKQRAPIFIEQNN